MEKNLLNSNISSRRAHNMANFSPLTAQISLPVWGTPANFNRFCILASSLQQRRSPDANQTLHDLWPSPDWYTIYTFLGAFAPLAEFCYVQNSLCVQVLHSPILAALQQGTPAAGVSQTAWYKEWNYGSFAESATYIWLGGHHVGHRPTF